MKNDLLKLLQKLLRYSKGIPTSYEELDKLDRSVIAQPEKQ